MMKLSYLKTHWTPEDAHAILSLLDELRDVLWHTYGDDITEHYQQYYAEKHPERNPECGEHQLVLFAPEQDDIIPF